MGVEMDDISCYEEFSRHERKGCDKVTENCIGMRKLAAPARWFDLETVLRIPRIQERVFGR